MSAQLVHMRRQLVWLDAACAVQVSIRQLVPLHACLVWRVAWTMTQMHRLLVWSATRVSTPPKQPRTAQTAQQAQRTPTTTHQRCARSVHPVTTLT